MSGTTIAVSLKTSGDHSSTWADSPKMVRHYLFVPKRGRGKLKKGRRREWFSANSFGIVATNFSNSRRGAASGPVAALVGQAALS